MAKVQFTDFRASVKSALRREKLEGQLADTSSGTARKDIGKVPYFQPHDPWRRGAATFRRHPGFTQSRENASGLASTRRTKVV
jgi:hypothetical protein